MRGDDVEFRKSRHSNMESDCVEIGRAGDGIRVRDSKARGAGTLEFSVAATRSFFDRIREPERRTSG